MDTKVHMGKEMYGETVCKQKEGPFLFTALWSLVTDISIKIMTSSSYVLVLHILKFKTRHPARYLQFPTFDPI